MSAVLRLPVIKYLALPRTSALSQRINGINEVEGDSGPLLGNRVGPVSSNVEIGLLRDELGEECADVVQPPASDGPSHCLRDHNGWIQKQVEDGAIVTLHQSTADECPTDSAGAGHDGRCGASDSGPNGVALDKNSGLRFTQCIVKLQRREPAFPMRHGSHVQREHMGIEGWVKCASRAIG